VNKPDPSEFRTRVATQELPEKALSTKMRVEFTIPADMCGEVMEAFETMNQQASIYESKACGCKKQKYAIDINRGTGHMEISDSDRKTVVSIVDSDKAEGLVDLVRTVVGRDGSGVVLSEVHDLMCL
jgi:hypothetical protein